MSAQLNSYSGPLRLDIVNYGVDFSPAARISQRLIPS